MFTYSTLIKKLIIEHEEKSRMGVVITARVHPGETNSSWMMQGLIDFLTSECEHAKVRQLILQHYHYCLFIALESSKPLCI